MLNIECRMSKGRKKWKIRNEEWEMRKGRRNDECWILNVEYRSKKKRSKKYEKLGSSYFLLPTSVFQISKSPNPEIRNPTALLL